MAPHTNFILNGKKYRLFVNEKDINFTVVKLTNGYFLGKIKDYYYDAISGLKEEEVEDFIKAELLA